MTHTPARFTFDLDLAQREEPDRRLPESAMSRLLAEAREEGFRAGYTAGEESATSKSARQLGAAVAALGDRVSGLAARMDEMHKATQAAAIELATVVARKLAARLVEAQPVAEIEALFSECLEALDGVPHLVIRCQAELAETVREVVMQKVETTSFAGRLVVLGEPEIALGDCRLEWVDGGLVRNEAATAAEIERCVAAFLCARGISRSGARGARED
jgi:flagellar assembly protein FliH